MNLVTLDFETYFDDDYTLKKMTTEEYIRDPRFKAHMVGLKYNSGKTQVQRGDLNYLIPDVNIHKNAVIAQKAQFDGLILSHHYGIRPAFWFDTLSMARFVFPHAKSHSLENLAQMLDIGRKFVPYDSFKGVRDLPPDLYARVAEGCATDCDLTYAVFQKLLPYMPRDELRLIDMTIRMFTEPALRLDRTRMEWYVAALAHKKRTLLEQLGVTKEDLGSNPKFAALLQQLGEEPGMKAGKNGPIYAFAKTDDYMRELLDHENEQLALLAEARIDTKSTGSQSRAQRLLSMDARGFLAVYLNYAGAHTLRDSGGDQMNWQNFKRIDYGTDKKPLEGLEQRGHIRMSIMAPPGYVICVVDASQIECRLLNWFAGQQDILDKFAAKIDIYSELASMFYGFPVTKANVAERGTGKQLELSCGYGAGGPTIVTTAKLGIYGPPVTLTPEQGKAARDLYRYTHPHVVALWKYAGKVVLPALLAGAHDFMWGCVRVCGQRLYGPDGTWLDYSNLRYGLWKEGQEKPDFYRLMRRGPQKMYGAHLIENVIQWLARMFVFQVALQVGNKYKVVMRTHDEVVYLVPTAEATEALEFGLDLMKTPAPWCPGIPLDAEGGYDVKYSK